MSMFRCDLNFLGKNRTCDRSPLLQPSLPPPSPLVRPACARVARMSSACLQPCRLHLSRRLRLLSAFLSFLLLFVRPRPHRQRSPVLGFATYAFLNMVPKLVTAAVFHSLVSGFAFSALKKVEEKLFIFQVFQPPVCGSKLTAYRNICSTSVT